MFDTVNHEIFLKKLGHYGVYAQVWGGGHSRLLDTGILVREVYEKSKTIKRNISDIKVLANF